MGVHRGMTVVEPKSGGDFAIEVRVSSAHVVLLLLFGDIVPVAVVFVGALFFLPKKLSMVPTTVFFLFL